MSRKDYIRIAAALRAGMPPMPKSYSDEIECERRQQWLRDVSVIAGALGDDNPRFDRARFEAAAGVNQQ